MATKLNRNGLGERASEKKETNGESILIECLCRAYKHEHEHKHEHFMVSSNPNTNHFRCILFFLNTQKIKSIRTCPFIALKANRLNCTVSTISKLESNIMPSVVFFHVGLFGVRHGYTRTHRHGRVANEKCTHTKSGRTRTHCRREYWMRCLHFAYVTMLKLHPNHYIMCILFCEVFCFKTRSRHPNSSSSSSVINALNSHDMKRDTDTEIQTAILKGKFLRSTWIGTHTNTHIIVIIIILLFTTMTTSSPPILQAMNWIQEQIMWYTVLFRSAMAIIWSKMRFKLCYNNH